MFHAMLLAAALDVPSSSPSPNAVPTAPAVNTQIQTSPTPAPEPAYRGLPSPLDPIFPSADFVGPTIGKPSGVGPGVRTYGWVDVGGELTTSKLSTYPMSYQNVPNRLQMDQGIFRIEKQIDTIQRDHFDWGFRLSNLYGTDYRFTTAQGWLSNQLLLRNQTYGYDPVEAYGLLYFPKWGQGTQVQVGRYISPPDIEAQLAPNNFLYSHSIMFTFDAYTQTGVLFSTMLSPYWTIQYGLHAGNDTAPWDGSAHLTGELFGKWTSHANKDSVLFGIDAINSGQVKGYNLGSNFFAHDNLQQDNATWTHVFNPGFQNEFEGYWLYSFNAYTGGTINNGPFYLGAGGGAGPLLPGRSTAIGFVDYLEKKLTRNDYLSFRTDYLNDNRGWRSGFPTAYGSVTLGVTHKVNPVFLVRPEFRVEKAFRAGITPYDNGTKSYQTSFGMDGILNFGNP